MMVDGVKEKVLARIKPSREEEDRVKRFVSGLIRIAKTVTGMDCVLVGSLGKFTWLSGDHDVDLFIMFPDVPREELEKQGLEFGKKIVKEMHGRSQIKYAEHPYVHAAIGGFDVDIVPCYRIRSGEGVKSAVDRSPLHLEYVLGKITEKQQDEVRLLKQFCKGAAVYGSDAKHLGFSGYICELLVLKYGTFEGVMASAANWHVPHVISFDLHSKGSFRHPLVMIDPTDANRNAAANISTENMLKFIAACRGFMKKPGEGYFFRRQPKPLGAREIAALQKRGTSFMALVMKKPDVIEDVLYPQLRKAVDRLGTIFVQNDFWPMRSAEFVHGSEIILLFEFQIPQLPDIKKMMGPPVFSRKHSSQFLEKYRHAGFGPYVEDDRWVVEKKREFTDVESFVRSLLRKNIQAAGVPANIARQIKKSKVESRNFWKVVKRKKKFSAFLREEYFSRLDGAFTGAST